MLLSFLTFIIFAPEFLIDYSNIIPAHNNKDYLRRKMIDKIHTFYEYKLRNNISNSNFEEFSQLLREIFLSYDLDRHEFTIQVLGSTLTHSDVFITDLHKFLEERSEIVDAYKKEKELLNYVLNEVYDTMNSYVKKHYYNFTAEELGLNEIYVINLKKRPDRLNHMKELLKGQNLNFTLFEAFYGVTMLELLSSNKTVPGLSPESKFDYTLCPTDKRTWNQIGCWQSHLHVLFQIRDKVLAGGKEGPVLILEDDVTFYEEFQPILKTTLPILPEDWEILAAGHCYLNCSSTFITNIQDVCKADFWLCLDGYIVRDLNTVIKLISHINTKEFNVIDTLIGDLTKDNIFTTYAIEPEIISQQLDIFGSNIEILNK